MKNIREQVGQLLTIGFEEQECGSELRNLLREIQPGGVIFFQRNIAVADQFRTLISQIREQLAVSPPFLAIDQEGGQVDRFRELLGPLPSAREAAQAGMAFELGDLAGRELAAFGLNLDFAPVLDVGSAGSRTILGTRTAGDNPQEVIRFAVPFLNGLVGWNILGCAKHFPGLGGGRKDSHASMPVIESSSEELWSRDLMPYFSSTVRWPMIMVAHAWYPQLESALVPESPSAANPTPASLSRDIIANVLRKEIGHTGPVVCDDLEMGGVLEGRSIEEAAVAAVRAGCDMLLVCRQASNVMRVYSAILQEAEGDTEFLAQVEQAAQRIELSKRELTIAEGKPHIAFANLEALARNIRTFSDDVRLRLARQAEAPEEELAED